MADDPELELQKELLRDCESRRKRLSEWEDSFIISIRKQLDAGKTLSEKQLNKLSQIWEKATERG